MNIYRATEAICLLAIAPALALVLAPTIAPTFASESAPPTVEQIINAHIEASGGRQAYEKLQNSVSRGHVEIKDQGIRGTVVITSAAPDQLLSEITFEGVGAFREGISGDVAWESNLIQGARIKTGQERRTLLRQARADLLLNWRSHYADARVEGSEEFASRPAWRVVFLPEEGKPEIVFIDQESYQLLGAEVTVVAPFGEITGRTYFSDLQKIGELTVPMRIEQDAVGMRIVMTFSKVEHNVDLPEGFFDLPEQVRALQQAQAAPAPAAP